MANLYFIHMNSFAHFDLKPENILFLSINNSYIIADFGISEKINPVVQSADGKQTVTT